MKVHKRPFCVEIELSEKWWDRLFKDRFIGKTILFFVIIREGYGDESLIVHEKVHIQQFWDRPLTQAIRYLISDYHRMNYEAEAYAKEMIFKYSKENPNVNSFNITMFSDSNIKMIANIILNYYNIKDIEIDEIIECIKLNLHNGFDDYTKNELEHKSTFWVHSNKK